MKKLKLEHGVEVITFEAPKAGFDISTASEDELKKYGFPYGLTDPKDQARYDHLKKQLKDRFHYVEPTFQVNPDRFHGPRKPAKGAVDAASGAETSGNWSGGVLHTGSGQNFKWVQGDWVVPNVGAPTQGKWYYSSSWIGLDGDGSGDVCQAGVECDVYQSGSTVTRNIYPWFEWYPLPETKITSIAVSPGDMVTMTICTPTGAGSTTATVVFANHTSGASTTVNFTAPAGTKLVGNCAEWIVEAPTVGGTQSTMADYGEAFFSVCSATTTAGASVNGGTGNTISLVSGSSTLATGIIVTPTVIQSSYTGAVA